MFLSTGCFLNPYQRKSMMPDIHIERSFHPVGQGAFYTERFDLDGKTCNVVYDCGALPKYQLDDIINQHFVKDKKIEYLFLSHLHEDHINGVESLLERCSVKYIFLPLLSPETKRMYLLENKLIGGKSSKNGKNSEDNFVNQFIEAPEKAVAESSNKDYGPSPIIVYVKRHDDKGNGGNEGVPETFPPPKGENPTGPFYISSGTRVQLMPREVNGTDLIKAFWCFVPFNFDADARALELKKELTRRGIDIDIDENSLSAKWQDKKFRQKLRKAYDAIMQETLNEDSMTLYSGPSEKINGRVRVCCEPCCCKCCEFGFMRCCYPNRPNCSCHRLGAIYTGDYGQTRGRDGNHRESWDALWDCYSQWKDNIGVLQIPHHGSKKNFNNKMCHIGHHQVVSVGSKNRYRHPSVEVIANLAKYGNPLFVTEDKTTKYTQCFWINCDDNV